MNSTRTLAVSKFNEFLNEKTSKKLEISLFNFIIVKSRAEKIERSWENNQFRLFYANKARSLYFNLKNGVLKNKIENKDFDIKHIPYMEPWDLWPEKYEKIFQKKLAKEMIQLQREVEAQSCTQGMFTCEKCHSNSTTFFSLQTRSADEPMTNYITCIACGHKWKD